MKITKKMFLNHLKYDWWKYIITISLLGILIYYGTYLKNRLKRFELFQVFLSSEIVDKSYIEESYHLIDGSDIQEVTYYSLSPDENGFYNSIQTQGLGASDLMLLPENYISGAFFPYISYFDTELINRCKTIFEDVEFYSFDDNGKTLINGVKVHDKNNIEYNNKLVINKYLKFDEDNDYYFFIPSTSENMGKYGKKPNRDLGLKYLDYFLKNEK